MDFQEGLYTLRWIIDNKWGSESEQSTARDIVTDLLGDERLEDLDLEEDSQSFNEGEKKKVAIVIGHNKYTGASAIDSTDEWEWNRLIAEDLKKELSFLGMASQIFIRDSSLGYGDAMQKHADNIGAYQADAAIELHFNSFYKESANGTEAIISGSEGAKSVARCILNEWSKEFQDLKLRHDSGVNIDSSGRGSGFNNRVPCPSLVWEPLFASNPKEWSRHKGETNLMAKTLAKGFECFLK